MGCLKKINFMILLRKFKNYLLVQLKQIVVTLMRLMLKVKVTCQPLHSKQVLLVVPNALTFAYLKLLWQELQPESGINLTFCFDKDLSDDVVSKLLASLQLEMNSQHLVSYRYAMLYPWDLIFFADVTDAHKQFSFSAKKIRIEHGLPAGKVGYDGHGVHFNKTLLGFDSKVAYKAIMTPVAPTKTQTAHLEMANPLEYFVESGCLRMDQLLEDNQNRDEIKENFGFDSKKKVVFITSSWGPLSLVQTWGEDFYSQLQGLTDKYQFIISAHPHNYSRLYKKGFNCDLLFSRLQSQGMTIIDPLQDWVPYLACADILITDYTSLSLYFVPLLRPIICMKIPEDFAIKDGNAYKMEKIAEPLIKPGNLVEALTNCENYSVSAEHSHLADDVCHHQGSAGKLMRETTLRVLRSN